MIFSSKVPSNTKPGTDIISYLSERFTYFSKDDWDKKINDGKVLVNGTVVDRHGKAVPNAIVSYDAGDFEEPPANLNYTIIYEDQWYLGINKPGNLLVHRAGKSFRNNLIYQLRYVHAPAFPNAHSTHRLDRDTSGVVLIAKDTQSGAIIGSQFASHAMDKEYLAIVKGIPDPQIKEIDIPIGKCVGSLIDYKFKADPDGKPAKTLIEKCTPIGSKYSLLKLHPLTGRTHQIRIHCATIGHPIVGDKLYDMDEEAYIHWRDNPAEFKGPIDFYRHALHCKSIGFKHPYNNEYLKIDTELPHDMQELIRELEQK